MPFCCFQKENQPGKCKNYNLNITDLWCSGKPCHGLNGTKYEEFIFLDRITEIIDDHPTEDPLFLFYTPHIGHWPLQVPQTYYEKWSLFHNRSL